MHRELNTSLSYYLVGGILALGCSISHAQALPSQRVGVDGKTLGAIALSAEFLAAGGSRELRMREVTIQPGGVLPMHSHRDRPSVSYVLSGTVTEYLDGSSTPRSVVAGQAYTTSGPRSHALVNTGPVPAVFLEIDLPPAK
ncbi:cupin domain-containing protein [Burkholderia cepacia]|uniref:cupin domain-containing protein n=1 Tax=Burkholderia cepacia TaxID=292 RepID=UPI00075494A3|nr:cupin domain-containing protein [Burkholderia cepacia]RRA19518.1 cupin domain-containing protein [Burkholderia cepacia]